MATQFDCRPCPVVGPKADPPRAASVIRYHPWLRSSTHTSLQVCTDAAGSPLPECFDVQVFDPSKNTRTMINLKSTDTADTLLEKYPHLALNGKPVPQLTPLRDLGVKPGAVFITFQRCIGG
ncbi:uncharacterized protein Hap1MRO34_022193 isoform 2-T2 [Clarias gariepinus]